MPPRTTQQAQDMSDLAIPPEASANLNHLPETMQDLANPPGATADIIAAKAMSSGMSGDLVKVILSEGEGLSGKESQFVRVNDMTWLVPRNNEAIIPVEAYRVLFDTQPPIAEGYSAAAYAKRFSVSVIERIPAPKRAA